MNRRDTLKAAVGGLLGLCGIAPKREAEYIVRARMIAETYQRGAMTMNEIRQLERTVPTLAHEVGPFSKMYVRLPDGIKRWEV